MVPYKKANIILAKTLRKNLTPWERKLWYEFLSGYAVRFQRQKTIDNYIVDFYCAKACLIVELDGGGHGTEEMSAKDEERTSALNLHNLKVLRFSNLDIDHNFYGVCTLIDAEVQKSLHHSGK